MADPLAPAPRPRLTDPFRLVAVRDTGLLDAVASPVLDRLAAAAARRVGAPVALVSLVDDAGQHFPGMAGLTGWAADARGTPLSHSFCQYVVARAAPLVVDDAAAHPLVRDNGAHLDLGVAAYAGVPLTNAAGDTLGALCAIDGVARHWTREQLAELDALAGAVVSELEFRATQHALADARARLALSESRLTRALAATHAAAWEWEPNAPGEPAASPGSAVRVSPEWGPLVGRPRGSTPSGIADVLSLVDPADRTAVRLALDDALAGRAAYDVRYRVTLPDGRVHALHDAGAVRRGPDGRATRVEAVVRLTDDAR